MEITIYSKPVHTSDGKEFFKYLTKLPLVDGRQVTAQVVFKKGCRLPVEFPCNIVVERDDISAPIKNYLDKDGVIQEKRMLYISKWSAGSPYVDTSTDDLVF